MVFSRGVGMVDVKAFHYNRHRNTYIKSGNFFSSELCAYTGAEILIALLATTRTVLESSILLIFESL